MLSRCQFRRLQALVRVTTSWLLLAAYVVTASGVPLPMAPVDATTASSATPFPCQGGHCGCRTAEQCWKSCCCQTPSERLAWAREHGVTPPNYLIVAALDEERAVASRPCCAARSCCAKTAKNQKSEVRSQKSEIVWVSLIEAQKCRGESPTWHNVPISLLPPPRLDCVAFELRIQPFLPLRTPTPPSASFAPPDPPPRIS